MQRLKLIRNIDALDGEIQFNAEPGRIASLMVIVEGTNDTGQTGTASDVGRFVIQRGEHGQTHNRTFDVFQRIGDIRAGTNLSTSVTAGAFIQSCEIPFFEIGFPSALNITGPSELNIRYQPASNVDTVFVNLSVKVYAKIADLGEAYQYKMMGNDLSIASATQQIEQLNQRNITTVYLDDIDSVIDKIQFEQNEKIVVSNVDFQALQANTIYNNRIEDPAFTLAQIMAATPGVPDSTLNGDNVLTTTTTGAGDVGLTVCSMMWS